MVKQKLNKNNLKVNTKGFINFKIIMFYILIAQQPPKKKKKKSKEHTNGDTSIDNGGADVTIKSEQASILTDGKELF